MKFFNLAALLSLLSVTPARASPNIIIIQPDDLIFYDEWGRPPSSDGPNEMPGNGADMPHIEDLRENGLQMLQAYTASPVCGTSRYSTITGKMPSRAASIRNRWDAGDAYPQIVTIPSTKLTDAGWQNDCSEENLAAVFNSAEDYETAMIGKWHLTRIRDQDYTYEYAVDQVKQCGFNHVGGLYIENLEANEEDFNNYSDGTFSHNMEWITYEAIKFINETSAQDKSFFMYFNPTVPHSSNNVEKAIDEFSCRDIADKDYEWPDDNDPWIKGMSEDDGCVAYRDTIHQRATASGGEVYNLGPIWLDDAIGALVNALIDNGIYDDTIIVFQEDHGMDTKSAIYEGGIRIPQFIHYPAGIQPGTFNAPVSVLDLAPTLMEFAGISQPYSTDGVSWKQAIEDSVEEESWRTDRCLFFEVDQDRAVRCGCYKYMDLNDSTNESDEHAGTYLIGNRKGLVNDFGGVLFDLCDGGEDYVTGVDEFMESQVAADDSMKADFAAVLQCHLDDTHPDADPNFTDCSTLLTDPPTDAPTDVSTDAPTDSSTEAPTSSCEDDASYFFRRARNTCTWIGSKPDLEKERVCSRTDPNDSTKTVSDFCPLTCGVC